MREWPQVPLEQIAAQERSAISKPYGSAMIKDDYRPSGVPVVRGVNLALGRFHDADFVFIEPELAARMPGAEMRSGDLVVTHRGTVGQVSMIPRQSAYPTYVASTSHVKVRLDERQALPEFYYYWFRSNAGRQSILRHASTVGVPGIAQPVATVKGLVVPLPSLAEQRGIAEVLGALDDKIAANDRIQSGLIDLADALFERATQGLTADTVTFGDVADVAGGGTPKTSVQEYWGGDVAWSTPTDVTGLAAPYLRQTARTITAAGLRSCSSSLYPKGSILMTSRATIGAFAIAEIPVAVNQGFIVVNAKDPTAQWWLFHEMRSRVPEFLSFANGATFPELPRGRFKGLPVRVPSSADARDFAEKVGPIHRAAAQISVESTQLATTRDELLPLLMSGRVRVKEAEKVAEEVL